MSYDEKNKDRLPANEIVLAVILTSILTYAAYSILRWLFTTPEGRQALAVLLPFGATAGTIALIFHALSPAPAASPAFLELVTMPARHMERLLQTLAWNYEHFFPGVGACFMQGAMTVCSSITVSR